MDGHGTYLTLRSTGETGAFGSDTIGVDLMTDEGTIRTALEALEEQRWSLALTGGMRLDGGSELSLSYNRDFSDEDAHDSFELRFLVPL